MSVVPPFWLRGWLVAAGLGLSLGPAAVRAATPGAPQFPALDTPAQRSVHARSAALLAITRAGRRLVAVGERGFVLLSDDNGRSWRQAQRVPVSVSLTAVQFVTPEHGWAVGHLGVVLHSDDGGETWIRQLDGIQAAKLALAAAQRRADQATDRTPAIERARADAQRLVADGPDKPFLSLYFRDARHGFVLGAFNLVFKTDDGGRHWQPWLAQVDNPSGFHLYGVTPAGGDVLLIAGEQGSLLRSDDGGQRFVPVAQPYQGSWFGLLTTRDGTVVSFGLLGAVYRSDDQGGHWQKSDSGTRSSISGGVVLENGGIVLTTASGEVLESRDDGRNFQPLASVEAPLTGVVQAADGRLVLSSMHGVRTLPPPANEASRRED